MKECVDCSICKELSRFYKNKNAKDGHRSECKKCSSLRKSKVMVTEYPTSKVCTRCLSEKEIDKFYKQKNTKDGHRSSCIECTIESHKNTPITTYESIKVCNKCGNEKELGEFSKYTGSKDGHSLYCKSCKSDYYEKNKEELSEKAKVYYVKNREYIAQRSKKYIIKNKELVSVQIKKRNLINRHIISWRSILRTALIRMNIEKTDSTIEMLGYSAEELKIHFESLFTEGMSWNNHGEWHIDHIIPINAFKPDTPPSIVNSLENLQPLWKSDNLSKGDKIYEEYKSMDIYIKYCKQEITNKEL